MATKKKVTAKKPAERDALVIVVKARENPRRSETARALFELYAKPRPSVRTAKPQTRSRPTTPPTFGKTCSTAPSS